MENLQSEVIELEFLEFSKGMKTISEEDFARILLRYTNLDRLEIKECLSRVKDRMPEEKVTLALVKGVSIAAVGSTLDFQSRGPGFNPLLGYPLA